jgi:hypothetical protein
MNDTDKGVIWFHDDGGSVRKGRLIDCDVAGGLFWVWLGGIRPRETNVVVILKNGGTFSGGKSEWCGTLRLNPDENGHADPSVACYSALPEGAVASER